MDSLAASGTLVPAASVSVVGAAGLGGGGFTTAFLAGCTAGAGTSFIAAVDSAGASGRVRAGGSAGWLRRLPLCARAEAAARQGAGGRRVRTHEPAPPPRR